MERNLGANWLTDLVLTVSYNNNAEVHKIVMIVQKIVRIVQVVKIVKIKYLENVGNVIQGSVMCNDVVCSVCRDMFKATR